MLNGEKCFIGNCGIANLHVVYTRKKGEKHLSGFIIEGEAEGVDNTVRHDHAGLRAFPFGKLRLKNVFVPQENLLGREDEGLKIAYHVIGHHGRPSLTGLALGIHLHILDLAYSFACQRKLYGKPIFELPDVRGKFFEIYVRFEQNRQSAYDAAHRASIGDLFTYRSLAIAKYLSGEHNCQSANIAAEIFGA